MMTTRRRFLMGIGGATAAAGIAGCLGVFGGEEEDDEELVPGEGVETDDPLLNSVANPSSQVPVQFFAGYQHELQDLLEYGDPASVIPRLGGGLAGLFDDQIEGVELSDFDRITGSIYHSSTISGGGLEIEPLPSGQSALATGEFDTTSIREFLENEAPHSAMGESEGFERYSTDIQGGQGVEALAFQEGTFIAISRTDVTSRSEEYDSTDETAGDALEIEFDQLNRDDAPIANAAPSFVRTVSNLDEAPIRAGTANALVPLGSDTGEPAFDEAIAGVTSAGISAEVGQDAALQRSVSYLDATMASTDVVSSAYEAANTGVPPDDWTFSKSGQTVTSRTTLTDRPSETMLNIGFPVDGYGSLFTRVDPSELGRDPPPRVFIQPELDDGTIVLTHVGGTEVSDLKVRYVHDGEEQSESWDGSIREGDEYRSARTIDSETQGWVVWEPDTVNAAVITRFET